MPAWYDPLLKPPPDPIALAGARPINTQKALRLLDRRTQIVASSNLRTDLPSICFANWVRSCQRTRFARSNSEIFLTSPNFLLTTLLACGLLAKIISLLDFNKLGHSISLRLKPRDDFGNKVMRDCRLTTIY